jgi:antirestriction protein
MRTMTGRLPLVLLSCIGCSGLLEKPERVAGDFWAAIQSENWEVAIELSTAPNARRIERLFGSRKIGAVSIGQVLTNESSALVETSIVDPDGRPLSFNTHLTRYEDSWKVDLHETASELRRASFAAVLEDVGEALQEGGLALSEALEQGAQEASEALREAMEELERELRGVSPR